MSLGQNISQRGTLFTVIAAVAVAAFVWFAFFRTGTHGASSPSGGKLAWFTIDDGKTWFADDRNKLPPFEKDGKTAYGCAVWSINGGKTMLVSHLYRFSEPAKKQITDAMNNPKADPFAVRWETMEIKRPGQTEWVKASSQGAEDLQVPQTSAADLRQVEP